ncbi:MAG: hypothetical protein PHW53_02310 [Patescibacteria group bacterium]|nr:hypothetical protein [Patescibacteria group bacterium]
MNYPHITFRKSAKKDFETLRAFTKDAEYDNGRNLNWAVFKKYPRLKIYFDKDKHFKIKNEKVLSNFIDETYRGEQINMNRALAQHKKRWEKIALDYFSLVDELFSGRKWPRGKYVALGTIWGMYPRFLEDKTFQIPFRHRTPGYISVVIAHELLHFMFYDYFYAHYPKYRGSGNNFIVWHISEIFNTVVQNSPAWLSRFKIKSLGYPEHKKIVARIGRTLYCSNTWDLNALVDKIIKEVQNQKINK